MFKYLLCHIIVFNYSCLAVPNISPRIVGGSQADIVQFPHQLLLEVKEKIRCGASIIKANIALTAAHCVSGVPVNYSVLRAGSSILGEGGTLHPASSFDIHDYYTLGGVDYDVALVTVSKPFVYDATKQPISITYSEPEGGDVVTVSGWGLTSEEGSTSHILRAVSVPVVGRKSCEAEYQDHDITPRMICAGGGKQGVCNGDSGGALILGGVQVGIVSWSVGCSRSGYPGVYTNVANAEIRTWIEYNAGV